MNANFREPIGGCKGIRDPQKRSLSASSRKILKEGKPTVSKPKSNGPRTEEAADFDAAEKFLSLLCSDTKAKALVRAFAALSSSNMPPRTCCAPRISRFCRVTSRTWTLI